MPLLLSFFNKIPLTFILIALLIASGYFYFNWSQNKLSELNILITKQEEQLNNQTQIIEHMNSRMSAIEDSNKKFNEAVEGIRIKTNELSRMYNLNLLKNKASVNPLDVEKQINITTNNLFNEMNNLTGSKK